MRDHLPGFYKRSIPKSDRKIVLMKDYELIDFLGRISCEAVSFTVQQVLDVPQIVVDVGSPKKENSLLFV